MKPTITDDKDKALIESNEQIKCNKEKSKFNENDDMAILIKKKQQKIESREKSNFRNNYKNYQYDYEEDFYEPRY